MRGWGPPSVVRPSTRWPRCLLGARRSLCLSYLLFFFVFFVGRRLVVPLSLVVGLFSLFLSFSSLALWPRAALRIGRLGSMGN